MSLYAHARHRAVLAVLAVVAVLAATLFVVGSPATAPASAHTGHKRPTVKVLTANLYVGNRNLAGARATIRRVNPVVAGLQEGHGNRRFRVPGYRKLTGTGLRTANPVLVRRGVPVESWRIVKVSDRTGPKMVNAPRFATIVDFRWHQKRWTLINTHLPVVSRRHQPNVRTQRVAREYAAGLARVLRIADDKRAEGRRVIVVGDLNDRPRNDRRSWRWEPSRALPREGFLFRRVGVDYVATHQKRRSFAHRRVIRHGTGSDHPWLATKVRY